MAKKENPYSTAFSAGSLLHKESDAIIQRIQDAAAFYRGEESLDPSVVPVNSEASRKRLTTEVKKRLLQLGDPAYINLYKEGSREDQLLILFYAACKTYRLVSDFMLVTVLDKWYHLDKDLDKDDAKSFIYKQMDKHPTLENLSLAFIKKMSEVLIRMLQELGLLQNGQLQKKTYNPRILKKIAAMGDGWFLEALLLNETERNEMTIR